MCGRYAMAKDPSALAVEFDAVEPVERLDPDYNVAPTKPAYIVVDRLRDGHEPGGPRERSLEVARWGLVPSWAKDPSIGARMINARAETVAQKPSFRSAFAKRRCLVPADGYYEWYLPDTLAGAARVAKQPYFIHPHDGSSLAMAGLYEWWRDASLDDGHPLAWRLTFTVITTEAGPEIAGIHDRMPVAIDRVDWSDWLAVDAAPGRVADIVGRARSTGLVAVPVSTRVNNVRNNDADLVAAVAPEN